MAVLLETNIGDLVIDLDVEGSPDLCRNFLKLAKSRYYSASLIYNVQANRFCQCGDPTGTGNGGACIYGVIESTKRGVSEENLQSRFLQSRGRLLTPTELKEKGRVVATEINFIKDTVGSQFLITVAEGQGNALDGYNTLGGHDNHRPLSLGQVTEDSDGVLDKINTAYCDTEGRPYADIRINRALVLHDPFTDPDGMDQVLKDRGVHITGTHVTDSPILLKPPHEKVEKRIQADQVDWNPDQEETEEDVRKREQNLARQQDKSRAVVLEMLGDLPSAEIKAPENVLFVCKLNAVTEDEDLELIFSRFDQNCKAEIIRDNDTGNSLQYAFIEFSTKQQCVEAYFKMNNALIDDRRIKVDFSQSVAKIWNRYTQTYRGGKRQAMPKYGEQTVGRVDKRRRDGEPHFSTANSSDDIKRRGGSHYNPERGFSRDSGRKHDRSRQDASYGRRVSEKESFPMRDVARYDNTARENFQGQHKKNRRHVEEPHREVASSRYGTDDLRDRRRQKHYRSGYDDDEGERRKKKRNHGSERRERHYSDRKEGIDDKGRYDRDSISGMSDYRDEFGRERKIASRDDRNRGQSHDNRPDSPRNQQLSLHSGRDGEAYSRREEKRGDRLYDDDSVDEKRERRRHKEDRTREHKHHKRKKKHKKKERKRSRSRSH